MLSSESERNTVEVNTQTSRPHYMLTTGRLPSLTKNNSSLSTHNYNNTLLNAMQRSQENIVITTRTLQRFHSETKSPTSMRSLQSVTCKHLQCICPVWIWILHQEMPMLCEPLWNSTLHMLYTESLQFSLYRRVILFRLVQMLWMHMSLQPSSGEASFIRELGIRHTHTFAPEFAIKVSYYKETNIYLNKYVSQSRTK